MITQIIVAIVVINFRRVLDTLECLESLFLVNDPLFHIFLVDNGSGNEDARILRDYANQYCGRITLTIFPENYGFSGAHNRLFEQLVLDEEHYEYILLLNNDTVVESNFLAPMLEMIDRTKHIEMVAARMMKYDDRTCVDNLGITFYKCGLASNRKSLDHPLLGPCGGCALYTTDLLRHLHQATGEYFDEHFFCYAEDTDFAWRAVLLGYNAAYAPDALVYHKGSIASGGPNSDFVLYHGIRNSLFVLIKDIPLSLLLRNTGWMIILHCAILLRYLIKGKTRVILRLYLDFLLGIPMMWRKRLRIFRNNKLSSKQINKWIGRDFYDRYYLRSVLNDLLTLLSKKFSLTRPSVRETQRDRRDRE